MNGVNGGLGNNLGVEIEKMKSKDYVAICSVLVFSLDLLFFVITRHFRYVRCSYLESSIFATLTYKKMKKINFSYKMKLVCVYMCRH